MVLAHSQGLGSSEGGGGVGALSLSPREGGGEGDRSPQQVLSEDGLQPLGLQHTEQGWGQKAAVGKACPQQ